MYRKILTTLHDWDPHAFDDDVAVHEFMARAYEQCVEWFGAPADAHKPTRIFRWSGNGCQYSAILRCYGIRIDSSVTDFEDLRGLIAHEMYHRVTMKRRTVRRIVWIDEMLASLTSHFLMQQSGHSLYVDRKYYNCIFQMRSFTTEDWKLLHSYRRPRFPGLTGITHPDNYGPLAYRLAFATQAILPWESIRTLVHFHTLPEWLSSLTPRQVSLMRHVLNGCNLLPTSTSPPGDQDLDYAPLAEAYTCLGHWVEAERRWQQIVIIEPENALARPRLAKTLYRQGCFEAATEVYRTAVEMAPTNTRTMHEMALSLWYSDQRDEALALWMDIRTMDRTYLPADLQQLYANLDASDQSDS